RCGHAARRRKDLVAAREDARYAVGPEKDDRARGAVDHEDRTAERREKLGRVDRPAAGDAADLGGGREDANVVEPVVLRRVAAVGKDKRTDHRQKSRTKKLSVHEWIEVGVGKATPALRHERDEC